MQANPSSLTHTDNPVPLGGPVDGALFRLGMRRLASSVCLITTNHADQRHGLVATSVSSLAAEPPSLIACVHRSASTHDPIRQSGCFCVNLLGVHQEDLATLFSDPSRRGERFHSGSWTTLATGAPVLADAVAAFDCRLERVVEHATHAILIAAVLDIRLDGPCDPLIHAERRFTRLAT
jgi:flavin reductase